MLKVGITGGIGSGKSIVSKIFSQLGVPVYNSDIEAKKLTFTNEEILQKITSEFGNKVFDEYGKLNTKELGQLVFTNPNLLSKLNAIVHPAVKYHFEQWTKKQTGHSYILKESAIIFEHHLENELDAVVVVLAPEEIRMNRVMNRDKLNREEVLQRIRNQLSDEQRKQKGNFHVVNDDHHAVIPQVLKIHSLLQSQAIS